MSGRIIMSKTVHGWVDRKILPTAKKGEVIRWDRHWWRVTDTDSKVVYLEQTEPPEPPPRPVPTPPPTPAP